MQIKNRVKDCKTVHYTQIEIIQGDLKELSKENYEKLRNEIRRLGITAPNFVWKHGKKLKCIDGTQRLRTYAQMETEGDKIPKIPIIEIDAENEKEAREMLLGYISQYGKITSQGLAEYLKESDLKFQEVNDRYSLPDTDLQAIHDEFYKDALDKKAAIEDDVPETPKDPISKLGDIYELGDHRLMCGDSTSINAVEKLMNGEKAEICFTSPPYNLGNNAKLRGYNGDGEDSAYNEKSDHKTQAEYLDFLIKWTQLAIENSTNVFSNIQILAGNKFIMSDYWCHFKNNLVDLMVWDKVHAQPAAALRVLNSVWEFIFIFSNEKNPKRSIKTGPEFRGTIPNIYRLNPVGKKDPLAKNHGAVFPVEFAKYFVENFSNKSVLDLFGGSGSTLIACEKTNRKCFMMELDTHYIDVIITRWCKYTGKDTIKRNGKPITWSISGDDPKPNTTLRKKTKGQPIAEKTV